MIRLILTLVSAAALAGVSWWGAGQRDARHEAEREAYALRGQLAQTRVAEGIARAELALERDRADALADAITEITGGPDAPLPDHIRAVLDGLRAD